MRFGASSWAFTFPFRSPRDDALVERMRGLGCDHFELGGESVTDPDAIDRQRLRGLLGDNGMTSSVCGIFTAELDLSSLDPDVRSAGMLYLRACLDVAEGIGANVVVGAMCGVGGQHIPTADERRARNDVAAEMLALAGPLAASVGVRLGLEPLNRYENNFLNTVDQAIEIVDAVDHPAIGVHLDLFHANIEEAGPARGDRPSRVGGLSTATPLTRTARRPGAVTCRGQRWPRVSPTSATTGLS